MPCSISSSGPWSRWCRVRLLALAWMVCLLPLSATASAAEFDQDAAWGYLVKQVGFGPRNPGSEGHEACLDWLIASLKERADHVEPHTFVIADPYSDDLLQLTNIKASFRPDAPVRVAFAAHWDTRPRADRDDSLVADTPIPGANDGASGVAVLLALADLLQVSPPSLGVDLLFFDGEDYGKEGDPENYLLGSRRFVADFPRYRPGALILLDMVGKPDLRIPMEAWSLRRSGKLVHVVFNRALALGLDVLEPVPGPAVLDDHIPFLERGIAAVDLIDMDYPAWHTLADTPENCSVESLGQIGRLLAALISEDFAQGRGRSP